MRYSFLIAMMCVCWVGRCYAQTAEPSAGASTEAETASSEAEPAAAVAPPIYANSAARDMTLMAEAMPSDQVLWWPEGDGQVLALYMKAISAEPVGAVLFVPDQDLHATHPQRLQRLRLALPEHGWTTLVVTLPVPDSLPTPEREIPKQIPEVESDKPSEQQRPETEEVFDDQTGEVASVDELNKPPAAELQPAAPEKPASEIVDARLAQAVQYLHGDGQFNLVLVAEGAGAVRAARLMEKMGFSGFRAVVLIDGRNQLQGETGDLLMAIAKMSVPMFDLYEGQHMADEKDVQSRKVAAKRAGNDRYVSLQIPLYEPSQERLIKRVRGFLDAHAKGVKVDNAQVIDAQ